MSGSWALALVLLGWNIAVSMLYGYDKLAAKWGRVSLRIPERVLLCTAVLFGAPGALLAMATFRHKTRHRSFRLLVPLCLIVQLLLLSLLDWH